MKRINLYKFFLATFGMCFVLLQSPAMARDDTKEYPIENAMQVNTVKDLKGVRFYFGKQKHPRVKKNFGLDTSRRATNAFGKSDASACQRAFLSTILAFHQRALKLGANAVINIKSITTGVENNSSKTYTCRAGNVIVKVYIVGEFVSI